MVCHLSNIARLKSDRTAACDRLDRLDAELCKAFVDAHKAGVRVDLLEWIEAHLRATGMAASTFGKDLLGDPGFVQNLREGRRARAGTDKLIRCYLAG